MIKRYLELNKKILVTGGAGYIGSHVCKALSKNGYEPITFDNLSRGNKWSVKWGPLEVGDILDITKIESVMKKYRPAAVMHFAAFAYIGESFENPVMYYRNNVVGSLNLFETMIKLGIQNCIFSSSCATYGIPQQVPIPVNHPQNPINPYGMSKLTIERMLRDFEKAYKLKHVSLRYFNAAGADPDGEIGELHIPETHLIPLILDVAVKDKGYIEIYGNDYDTPDGTCIRDYIHVSDLAEAHLLALNYLLYNGKSKSFNLGTGKGYSVLEIINTIKRLSGKNIPFQIKPRRLGDPPILMADASSAIEILGWKQKYSSIGREVNDALKWHIKVKNQNN